MLTMWLALWVECITRGLRGCLARRLTEKLGTWIPEATSHHLLVHQWVPDLLLSH